jgi:chitinase
MAKSVHDAVLDGALDVIKNNCDIMTVCTQQPLTFAEANATYALASATMTGTDFIKANGDTSGRKVTVGQKSGVTVATTGTATHVALLDSVNSRLLYVTTSTSQVLTAGNTMTFNAWDIEIADPT